MSDFPPWRKFPPDWVQGVGTHSSMHDYAMREEQQSMMEREHQRMIDKQKRMEEELLRTQLSFNRTNQPCPSTNIVTATAGATTTTCTTQTSGYASVGAKTMPDVKPYRKRRVTNTRLLLLEE